MIYLDPALLAEIRCERCCWCGRLPPSEAAHIYGKQQGGGFTLDVEGNCLPLCRWCHNDNHHAKHPTRDDLLALAAARMRLIQPELNTALLLLRRLPRLELKWLSRRARLYYGLCDEGGRPTLAGKMVKIQEVEECPV